MAGFLLPSELGIPSAFADLSIRSDRFLVAAFAAFSFLSNSALLHVDRACIKHGFDVCSVEFLDHLDASPAVLGNLIDVSSLHQTKADVGMPQAVARSQIAVAVV